jgi:hypothetical protein
VRETSYDLRMHCSPLRTLAFILISGALLTGALPTKSHAQGPTMLLVRVRDSLSDAPLPNAEVTAIG